MIWLSTAAPPPVAAFTATSPVTVGQHVTYVNLSYDPATGHSIIFSRWIDDQPSFPTPGAYLVELWVMDDRGLWGFTSRVVSVVATPSPPPPQPSSWSVVAPSSPLPRGGSATIRISGHPTGSVHLIVPSAFRTTISVENQTLDYATLDSEPFTEASGVDEGVLYVPWTETAPSDGTYSIGVTDGETVKYFDITVKGTLEMAQPIRASQNAP